jgi:hypothetical protein
MKIKIFTLAIASVLMLSAASVNAQDRKTGNTELQADHQALKDRYEQRKQAIHDAYKRDMASVDQNSGLSSEQRREQRRVIQERFNQQKKELQAAHKADMKALQAKRKANNGVYTDDDDIADKKNKDKAKKEKAQKAEKKDKSSKGDRSFEKGQGKGKGQMMSKGKGKRS